MRCAACEFDAPDGARFCQECGAAFAAGCPGCGQAAAEMARGYFELEDLGATRVKGLEAPSTSSSCGEKTRFDAMPAPVRVAQIDALLRDAG